VPTKHGKSLKGTKVAPKFRGPKGETWAGRGLRPEWLKDLIKQGSKLEEFAIGNVTDKKAKRRLAKKHR
jgi:DNA-binding protein H-NS